PQVDAHRAVFGAVLKSIADQVRDDLRHPVRVPTAPGVTARVELDAPFRIRELQLLDDGLAEIAQVHAPGLDREPAAQATAGEIVPGAERRPVRSAASETDRSTNVPSLRGLRTSTPITCAPPLPASLCACRRASGGRNGSGWPSTSDRIHPEISSAARFQISTPPSASCAMIGSGEASMSAWKVCVTRREARSARLRSVMSRSATVNTDPSGRPMRA